MRTVQEINTAIITGTFTNTELASIIDAVKFTRSRLAQATKQSLRVGDSVEFTSSKTGHAVQGIVTKIAIKYVTVKTHTGLWRVPANMLAKISDMIPAWLYNNCLTYRSELDDKRIQSFELRNCQEQALKGHSHRLWVGTHKERWRPQRCYRWRDHGATTHQIYHSGRHDPCC